MLMQYFRWCFITFVTYLLVISISQNSFGQMQEIDLGDGRSEGKFFVENNIVYTDAIVVKFKDYVIDIPTGIRNTDKLSIQSSFTSLRQLIDDLDNEYGPIKIVKHIPRASWGDVIRKNKRTGKTVRITDLSQLFSLRFQRPVPRDIVIGLLEELPEVEYAHEPVIIFPMDAPNDEKYNSPGQWNLDSLDAQKAWDITHGDSTIRIAIVDDGVDQDHIDLAGKIDGTNSVEGAHGTNVAGVVAACTNNDSGVASLGWDLSLYTLGGYSEWQDWIYLDDLITEATDSARVINMSWRTLHLTDPDDMEAYCKNCDEGDRGDWAGESLSPHNYPPVSSVISDAIERGVICVTVAGNISANSDLYSDPENYPNPSVCDPSRVPYDIWPAMYEDVITVSATQVSGSTEIFVDGNNYGDFIDVAAPGENIWTTKLGGGYESIMGTSVAAPHVSALVGLILSLNDTLSIQSITNILEQSAEDLNSGTYPGKDSYLGYGRINAYEALKYTIENYYTTLDGSVAFSEDITIASGTKLTINAGTTITFSNGATLIIEGELSAEGTSGNKINFTSASKGDWSGIYFASSAASTSKLKYCVINNADIGIYLNDADVTIETCEIKNCDDKGMYVYSGTPKIYDNYIHDVDTDGLVCNAVGSIYIRNNTIKSCENGVHCYGNNTVKFHGYSGYSYGKNKIADWDTDGFYITGGTPCLGLYSPTYARGYNDILRDHQYAEYSVENITENEIDAEKNWWGNSSPIASWFEGDVNYDSPLSSSQGAGSSLEKETTIEFDKEMLYEAVAQFGEGHLNEAYHFYLELIKRYPESRYGGTALAWAMGIKQLQNELAQEESILETFLNHQNTFVHNKAALWLETLYTDKGDHKAVEKLVQDIPIETKTGLEIRLNWADDLLRKFGDKTEAEKVFSNIIRVYPDLANEIQDRIKMAPQIDKRVFYKNLEANNSIEKNSNALAIYPNPFNASTKITYYVSDKGRVSIRIYDILGREIRTLIDEEKEAGNYISIWDGKDNFGRTIASGIYLCSLLVNGQHYNVKLSYLK